MFPLSKAKFDNNELEEERRLMYVAITRAKDILFISYANSRQQWGQTKYNSPSRFLEELPDGTEVIALFCVEREPAACHRSLVAERLQNLNQVFVDHLMP